jgi:hypothetical protein
LTGSPGKQELSGKVKRIINPPKTNKLGFGLPAGEAGIWDLFGIW